MQFYAKQFLIDDLKFPISNVTADISSKDNFRFVKALENIGYQIKIGKSMENYLKASDSQFKMIQTRASISENLENYDEDIKEIVLELKDSHIDQLTDSCDEKEKSRRFFDDSIEKLHQRQKLKGLQKHVLIIQKEDYCIILKLKL